jgi:SSS family solute:Na+ symporter
VLTALVPGSLIMMTAATLFSRNIVAAFRPGQSDDATMRLARIMVPVIAIIGAYFTISGSDTIVALLLMGYSFVTQLFPSLICSLLPRNPATKQGAAAGIILGVAAVVYFTLSKETIGKLAPALPQLIKDLNIGIIALALNIAALIVVSLMTAPRTVAAASAAE